jgi:hypothetical protein
MKRGMNMNLFWLVALLGTTDALTPCPFGLKMVVLTKKPSSTILRQSSIDQETVSPQVVSGSLDFIESYEQDVTKVLKSIHIDADDMTVPGNKVYLSFYHCCMDG